MNLNKSTIDRIKEGKAIAILWDIDDVIQRYADNNDDKILPESVAMEVLKAMESRHDCNYGVTWETIDFLTDSFL